MSEERGRREKADALLDSVKSELSHTNERLQEATKEASEATSQLETFKLKMNDTKLTSGATNTKLQQELNLLKQQHLQLTQEVS